VDAAVRAEAPDADDQLRSLHGWLADLPELRGAVSTRQIPPPEGALGPVLDALAVALGPAGAVTAFATTLIAWLRTRRGDVRIKVTLADGRSAEVTAEKVAGLDAAALDKEVRRVAALLEAGQDGAGEDEADGLDGR
jgi:hypothetical protein